MPPIESTIPQLTIGREIYQVATNALGIEITSIFCGITFQFQIASIEQQLIFCHHQGMDD